MIRRLECEGYVVYVREVSRKLGGWEYARTRVAMVVDVVPAAVDGDCRMPWRHSDACRIYESSDYTNDYRGGAYGYDGHREAAVEHALQFVREADAESLAGVV